MEERKTERLKEEKRKNRRPCKCCGDDLTIAEPAPVAIPPIPQVAEPQTGKEQRKRKATAEREVHFKDQLD